MEAVFVAVRLPPTRHEILGNRILSDSRVSATQGRRPQLTTQPQDVQVPRGGRAYMNCHAEGYPQPKIAWFHNEYVEQEYL